MLVADARHRGGECVGESFCRPRAVEFVDASPLAGQGTESADLHSLSADLEAYEQSRTPRLARAILQRQRLLAEASDARQNELANQIEQNYRNANVRLALSAELLQRFVPQQQEEMSPVRDRIAGTPVRGQSITTSENKVQSRAGRRTLARQFGVGRHGRFRHRGRRRTGESAHAGHDRVQRPEVDRGRARRRRDRARARPTPTTPAGWSASAASSIGCRS